MIDLGLILFVRIIGRRSLPQARQHGTPLHSPTSERHQMQTLTAKFIAEVETELARARKLFPENRHMLAALGEETGELANALIENDIGNPTATAAAIWKEAVQSAVMAARIATEGDASFRYRPDDAH